MQSGSSKAFSPFRTLKEARPPAESLSIRVLIFRLHTHGPIGGDTGDFVAVSLIAGTVFVFGKPGIRIGAGMKRGTIALFGERAVPLADLPVRLSLPSRVHNIYLRQLCAWHFPVKEEFSGGMYRRYSGDLVALGKGEILMWEH